MLPTKFQFIWWGVSEEKINMWKVNWRQTTDAKWWQKLILPLARWAKNTSKLDKKILYTFTICERRTFDDPQKPIMNISQI
jgi:hypothetical protein